MKLGTQNGLSNHHHNDKFENSQFNMVSKVIRDFCTGLHCSMNQLLSITTYYILKNKPPHTFSAVDMALNGKRVANFFITPHTCARGKVIGHVVVIVVVVVHKKIART